MRTTYFGLVALVSLSARSLCLLIGLCVGQQSFVAHADEVSNTSKPQPPLQERIDQLVEASAVGPLARQCSDSDFLRRVCLDLTGIVPSAERVEQFLADPSADKRERAVDELLSSSDFCRHMTIQFSVLLLERKSEKNIPQQAWESYLYETFQNDRPLDQLISELIYAENPSATEAHPASKYLLTREAEPNALTRDVGRHVFGMDMQCAQCHDHPLIANYFQEDYYGLYAFLSRTVLFTTAPDKKVRLAEKPDGEASFKSVFTGNSQDRTSPRLPKEVSLFDEPRLNAEDAYRVKPQKTAPGVLKYSRRQALAKMISSSEQFRRNFANRIWAFMFARGIVHPLDFHLTDNSPTHPALLKLLADEFEANGFQLRPLLRAIALTRTYQRSCEPPSAETLNFQDVAARSTQLSAALEQQRSSLPALQEAADRTHTEYRELVKQFDNHVLQTFALEKAVREALEKRDKARVVHDKSVGEVTKAQAQSQAVAEAADKLRAAVAALPEDKLLVETTKSISERADKLKSALAKLTAAADEKAKLLEQAQSELAKQEAALTAQSATRIATERLQQLERAQIEAARAAANRLDDIHALERQSTLCQTIAEYQSAATSEPAKADTLWQSIVEQWTIAGQVAPLKPLSPEQLTLSGIQATGAWPALVKQCDEQIDKAPPQALKLASEADKDRMRRGLRELRMVDSLRSQLDQFAALYGGSPGEDYQATVNQALFFGNGSIVDGWLQPKAENLTARLNEIEAAEEMAEQLYLSILSRPATDEERRDVAESMKQTEAPRLETIRQWAWALLSSNEFRFNH